MNRPTLKWILAGILSTFMLWTGCNQSKEEPPWVAIAGYTANLIYHEPFTEDLSEWTLEGNGEARLTDEGMLKLLAYQGGNGLVLWAPVKLSGSFQLEYEVDISDSSGTNAVLFCAQSLEGEDLVQSSKERTGALSEYSNGALQNYMITYNTVHADGSNKNQSRVRKNPQYLLLSHSDGDPCLEGSRHLIDVVKMSNRIQFYVNGGLIHDVRDKGGFDAPVYMEGRFGFRVEPVNKDASVMIHRVKLYHLKPI